MSCTPGWAFPFLGGPRCRPPPDLPARRLLAEPRSPAAAQSRARPCVPPGTGIDHRHVLIAAVEQLGQGDRRFSFAGAARRPAGTRRSAFADRWGSRASANRWAIATERATGRRRPLICSLSERTVRSSVTMRPTGMPVHPAWRSPANRRRRASAGHRPEALAGKLNSLRFRRGGASSVAPADSAAGCAGAGWCGSWPARPWPPAGVLPSSCSRTRRMRPTSSASSFQRASSDSSSFRAASRASVTSAMRSLLFAPARLSRWRISRLMVSCSIRRRQSSTAGGVAVWLMATRAEPCRAG